MILSNRFVRTYFFGSKVAEIHNKSFQCCVSTAKEGLFQRESTIILEPNTSNTVRAGAAAAGLRPCGKVIYSPTLRKGDRLQFHDTLAKMLDDLGEEGCTLEEALEQIFTEWKRRGVAAETVNLAADQGQADAQVNLGELFVNDEGTPQDYAQAAACAREVAEQGYPKAQFFLGDSYHEGLGVPRDDTQAAFWWRKAAEQGFAPAQYSLGNLYYHGQGLPQDYAQAALWFRKAAEQGGADAQYNLGHLYYNGKGVPQDYAQAALWFSKAAEQGDADAQSRLGFGYLDGQGVPQDYAQAALLFRKAAQQGNAAAQGVLGVLYYEGLGVPQDYAEVYFWCDLAAAGEQDTSKAKDAAKHRDEASSHLTPADLARVQAKVRQWLKADQAKPQ